VLAQDTGFSEWLPCGKGVIAFTSPGEVVDGIASIEADYQTHCHNARALATEYFATERVLVPLIDRAMAPPSVTLMNPPASARVAPEGRR
jgi:hypothetical protein